ncbi:MAG: ABC transporter permease [Faecalibacterium sp.]|jgi:putative ABC transport system permease protein|nr:ABC transporter permease [Faecalibacterium sp.]
MAAYLASLNPAALLRVWPGDIAQGLVWGIMALGVYMTFKILNFADLTVDGSIATGGAVCVMLLAAGCNPGVALVAATLSGVVCGMVTGILHTVLGIPDILAGILTQIALYSINLNIMGKANQSFNVSSTVVLISSGKITMAIVVGAIFCAVLIGLLYWYFGTEQGSAIRATGCNPNMARAQGVNTDLMKVITLALSNGLVALAGGMISQYQGFADVNMGRGSIVIGLAAVIIGDVLCTAIFHKHLNFLLKLIFTVLGAIIYYIVYGFVLWLKFPSDDMKLLTAIVVAIFLSVPYLKGKYFSKPVSAAKKEEKNHA